MSEKRYIEQVIEILHIDPQKVILKDQTESVTRQQLDELSGKVFTYLCDKGIGREDFVMVCLPRGVKAYIAQFGIWKCGAAMVLLENTVPAERFKFIYADCSCKLCISSDNWEQIMQTPYSPGYVVADKHDAAFALYTSGSEGEPKGVLHEYGKLELCHKSLNIGGDKLLYATDKIGVPLPLSATAAFVITTAGFSIGTVVDVLPMEMVVNAEWMAEYVNAEKITITGLVPSMIMNNIISSPYIRYFVTGTEMSSGIYLEEYPIANFYGQTEVVMIPFSFVVDKLYDNTPIGKPTGICPVYVLDDKEEPVAEGETGELCYENPYTRGFINDEPHTKDVFRNGLYHTGDIVRCQPDGNYVVVGRKSDMIKINGNRIEPAEVEAAVKHVLGIDWAFAKGYVEEGRSYICVYYKDSVTIDYAHLREELVKLLPLYMIPTYLIHIDRIPRLPNGKVDRKALQAPRIEDFKTTYTAPCNRLEERLCTVIAQILKLDKVGVNDDFFFLGGDSVKTIQLISELGIDDLAVQDIYSGRTPRKIADCWLKKQLLR